MSYGSLFHSLVDWSVNHLKGNILRTINVPSMALEECHHLCRERIDLRSKDIKKRDRNMSMNHDR